MNLAGIGDDIGVGDSSALGLAGFNVVVLGRHVGGYRRFVGKMKESSVVDGMASTVFDESENIMIPFEQRRSSSFDCCSDAWCLWQQRAKKPTFGLKERHLPSTHAFFLLKLFRKLQQT